MKLGILAGAGGAKIRINLDRIKHAENLGYDSVWTAEAWGGDAVTSAAWMLAHTTRINVGTAIMQMPARTPAMAAMTAMSLAELSGGGLLRGWEHQAHRLLRAGMAYLMANQSLDSKNM